MTGLFDRRFPAELGRMKELRRELRAALAEAHVTLSSGERVLLVVDEIVSNAIEHGRSYRRSQEPIRVVITRAPDQTVTVVIEDVDVPAAVVAQLTRELTESADARPHALLERGRGLFLIHTYLADLVITAAGGGGMRVQGRLVQEVG